jgi:primosomal protein N' (replication factor Y)
LVAVVNVDQLLFYQDYRAHEWAFQRLIQLAGRAGRSHSVQGDAMLYAQSFDPHHPVLQWVVDYNFNAITDSELNERAQFQYPPHVKIIRIQTKSKNFETNLRAAQYLVSAYKRIPGIKVLGPQAPAVSRIRNWYLQNIIIKIQTERNLLELRKQLKRMEHSFNAVGNFQGVRLAYHVDHI